MPTHNPRFWCFRARIAATVGAAAVAAVAVAQPSGKPGLPSIPSSQAPADGNTLIRPSILAERTALVPGEKNWIAVRLLVAPKWHTYWRNAGESGVPATFVFTAPDWLTIGDPVWPAPKRYALPSGGVDYIYENAALVLFPVTVTDPPTSARAEAEITVEVDWLVCQEMCLPGSKTVSAVIPIWPDASPSEHAPAFKAARARVPIVPDASTMLEASFAVDTLTIAAPGAAEIEFFPFESAMLAFPVDALSQGISETGTLRFAYDRPITDAKSIAGAVRIRDAAGTDRFYEITVPIADTPPE